MFETGGELFERYDACAGEAFAAQDDRINDQLSDIARDLGVSPDELTTNRYAEITTRLKEAALRLCEPPTADSDSSRRTPVWRDDQALLAWLASL